MKPVYSSLPSLPTSGAIKSKSGQRGVTLKARTELSRDVQTSKILMTLTDWIPVSQGSMT